MAPEEHASPVETTEGDWEMKFVVEDCRRAFASIVQEEKLLEKKRRYLSESFVRNDDADLQDIRMLVQRGFSSSAENEWLNRTRSEMGEVIEESSPESLAQSQSEDHFENASMLSQILSNLTSLTTPVSSSMVSSISNILEGLDVLPSLALIAMNRKLKDVAVPPQFPIVFSCKRNVLIARLRRKCHKILSTLPNGVELPKPIAKALSVIFLSVKQITRQADSMTTKIFPFIPEIENLQNEILKAIWSLPNVKRGELRHLQHVIAPNANLPSKSLRRAFHNYLMEYLFQCDEVHVPKTFLVALKVINKGSGSQLLGGELTEEVDAILNVSSQLRQVVWDSFPDESMDQEFANAYADGLGASEDNCDIIIDENEDCSTFGYSDYLQICVSDDEVEGTGDSMPVVSRLSSNSDNSSAPLIEGRRVTCNSKDESQWNQSGSSAELSHQPTNTNMTNRYLAFKNICDETSLVAYKLIGHLLEELVQNEGKRADKATELCLEGGSSSRPNCQDPEKADVLSGSLESAILQVIGETLPSFPSNLLDKNLKATFCYGGVERVKELRSPR